MKIQLLFVIVCGVATLALAQPRKTDEDHQNGKSESDDQALANENNKSVEKLVSSNEPSTERSTRNSWVIRREQNAKQIHLFKHAERWPRRNISDTYSRLREHRLPHIYDRQRKLHKSMPAESLNGNKQHICHHHKNRTTTTTTTTTSRTPVSEMEEVLVKRPLMTPN